MFRSGAVRRAVGGLRASGSGVVDGPDGRGRRPLALAALLALLALAGCEGPPPAVCDYCGTADTTAVGGVEVEVEHSQLVADVRANGTVRYRAVTVLDAASADRLRSTPGALDEARASVRRGDARWGPGGNDPEPRPDATVRLDGRRLVVAYTVADHATAVPGGAVVYDRFYDEPPDRGLRVGADRLVVRGPEGTTVTRNSGGRQVGDRAVAWAGGDPGGDVEPHSVVVFAPRGGPVGYLLTRVALGATVAPRIAPSLAIAAGPTALALLALFGGLALARHLRGGLAVRTVGVVLAGAVGPATFAVLAVPGVAVVGRRLPASLPDALGPVLAVSLAAAGAVSALAVAGALAVAPLYLDRDRVGAVLDRAAVPVGVAVGAVVAGYVLLGGPDAVPTAVAGLAPVAVGGPLGYAVGTDDPARLGLLGVLALAPVGVALPVLPTTTGGPLVGLAVLAWGVGAALCCATGFLAGYAVAGDADPADLVGAGPSAPRRPT